MKLQDWINERGTTQKWVADKIGVPAYKLWNMIHGKSEPSLQEVVDIEYLTKGKVCIEDWLRRKSK